LNSASGGKGGPIQFQHLLPVDPNPVQLVAPGALFGFRPLLFRRLRPGSGSIFGLAGFAASAFAAVQLLPQVHDLGLRLAQIRRQRLDQIQQQPDTLAGTLSWMPAISTLRRIRSTALIPDWPLTSSA
jgi:hypothetical protein